MPEEVQVELIGGRRKTDMVGVFLAVAVVLVIVTIVCTFVPFEKVQGVIGK